MMSGQTIRLLSFVNATRAIALALHAYSIFCNFQFH